MTGDLTALYELSGMLTGQRALQRLVAMPPGKQEAICALAERQGVAPLLYYRVQEGPGLSALSPRAGEILVAAHGQTAGYNLLAYETALQCTRRFAEAGLTAIWFKGLPLALTAYPALTLRPMVDIDVLVDPRQTALALALIESLAAERPAMLSPQQDIHAVFNLGPGGLTKLELHWGLIAPEGSRLAPPLDWFIAQRTPEPIAEGGLIGLQPEAHVLYLAAHAELAHGEAQFRLGRYLDIHLLLSTVTEFCWELLIEQAVVCRWTYAVERALTLTERFFETPLPPNVLTELRRRRPPDEDVSFVQHLQYSESRWERTQERLRSMSWSRRIGMTLALLTPPADYVRWKYGVKKRWQLPFYYCYRWLDAIADIIGSYR
jgi:hypothetical protein